jgi:non-ribosomal peptide synthetase component F
MSFDDSIFDTFVALLHGSKLLLVDRSTALDIPAMQNIIKRHRVTHFNMTTALFEVYADLLPDLFKKWCPKRLFSVSLKQVEVLKSY